MRRPAPSEYLDPAPIAGVQVDSVVEPIHQNLEPGRVRVPRLKDQRRPAGRVLVRKGTHPAAPEFSSDAVQKIYDAEGQAMISANPLGRSTTPTSRRTGGFHLLK
jgi:hypothetical protein